MTKFPRKCIFRDPFHFYPPCNTFNIIPGSFDYGPKRRFSKKSFDLSSSQFKMRDLKEVECNTNEPQTKKNFNSSWSSYLCLYNNKRWNELSSRLICNILATLELASCPIDSKKVDHLWNTVIAHRELLSMDVLKGFLKNYLIQGSLENSLRVITTISNQKSSLNISHLNIILKEISPSFLNQNTMNTLFSLCEETTLIPDLDTFFILISSLNSQKKVVESTQLLRRMLKFNILPNREIYNSFIEGFLKINDVSTAQYYYQRMRDFNVKPNLKTYELLLQGHATRKDIAAMKQLRIEAEKNKIKTSIFGLNAFLTCYAKLEDFAKLLETFHEIYHSGLKPSIHSYTIFLTAVAKKYSLHKILQIVKDMEEDAIQKDIVIYNIIIGACCRQGEIEKAKEMFRELEKNGLSPDSNSFHHIIRYYSSLGDQGSAKLWLDKMKAQNLKPQIHTLNSLLLGFVNSGNLPGMTKTIQEFSEFNLKPNLTTCNIFIESCARLSKVNEAIEMFHFMKDAGISPNIRTYNWIIYGFGRKGNPKKAMEWFQLIQSSTNLKPSIATYELLVYCFARSGDYVGMMDWFNKIRNSDIPKSTRVFNTMILGFCKGLHLREAFGTLGLMKRLDIQPSIHTFRPLIESCIHPNSNHFNGLDKALSLFDEMLSLQINPDVAICSNLIFGCAREERWEVIRWLIPKLLIIEKDCKTSLFKSIFSFFLNQSKPLEEVIDFVKWLGLPLNVHGYNALMEKYIKLGDVDLARKVIDHMERCGLEANIESYNIILYGLSQGHGGGILSNSSPENFFQEMQQNPSLRINQQSYHIMIFHFLACQTVPRAEYFYNKMLKEGFFPDIDILDAFIYYFCQVEFNLSKLVLFFDQISRFNLRASRYSSTNLFFGFVYSSPPLEASAYRLFVSMSHHSHLPSLESLNPIIAKNSHSLIPSKMPPFPETYHITQSLPHIVNTTPLTLNSMLMACINASCYPLALKILDFLDQTFSENSPFPVEKWLRYYLDLVETKKRKSVAAIQ